MVMQVGMGLSKVMLLVGAGFTGSILMRNGMLSDILFALQGMVKRLENNEEKGTVNSEHTDALASQGLQHIAEGTESGNFDKTKTEAIMQNDVDSLEKLKSLCRTTLKC